MELTHASFFSGVGGLDLGLERAGWRTVSFSEIDPYASAVLAERWPGVPNLGDIVALSRWEGDIADPERDGSRLAGSELARAQRIPDATLWSGGFPCQDVSVAGKRAGFGRVQVAGRPDDARPRGRDDGAAISESDDGGNGGNRYADATRSGLAFAFLDLVERHRPPAILLENVPGLLSSNKGRDFGALLGRLGELGYWWAYRVLDARHFGVPQRRRRVFIVGIHAGTGLGADSAAEVLSVGTRCGRHPATGHATGEGVAERASRSPDEPGRTYSVGSVRTWYEGISSLGARDWRSTNHIHIGSSPDPDRMRASDGLAGRLDDLAPTLRVGPAKPQDGGPGDTVPIIAASLRASDGHHGYSSPRGDGADNLTLDPSKERDAARLEPDADSLLPLGLDSHRYRCCGNGVVSDVSEYIGRQLIAAIERAAA